MIDWTKSMQQTFEYYRVDPGTWRNRQKLTQITGANITRDESNETLGSATIECEELLDECYVRVVLVCIQDKESYSFPLGTFLVQTPSTTFNGRMSSNSLEAYTPLLELKDSRPPFGYAVMKGENIMDMVSYLTQENVRAPVVPAVSDVALPQDFISDFNNDTWLTFLTDLAANAKFKFDLDELGRIIFAPDQKLASLQPVWTYTDDNSSILYPDITMNRDLYGIPNVAEVLVSSDSFYRYARVVNDDPNSPISTVNRGREVVHRVSNPSTLVSPTQDEIQNYAEELLESLSVSEYTLTYKHGYCPVRVGDCVRLNYQRAGITNIKARVTSQTINCKTGCVVTEKAKFTTKLWEVS